MTPFGKQLHAQLQSLYAPKVQLQASSYGQGQGGGPERVIESEKPVSPAPAPAPAASSPIADAVGSFVNPPTPAPTVTGGTDVKSGVVVDHFPPPEEPPAVVAPPVVDPVIPTPTPQAPEPAPPAVVAPAPPAPTVADTPEVAYQDMYQTQAQRSRAYQTYMRGLNFTTQIQ